MKAIICGALMVVVLTGANAAEDIKSANDVLPYCKLSLREALATHSAYQHGWCKGAIRGLVEAAWRRRNLNNLQCIDVPKKAFIQEQPVKVVIRYADMHPGELTQPFLQVATSALREVWPCKK